MKSFFILFIMVILCITAIKSANNTDVKNLLTQSFTTNSYNKLVRPIVNQSQPVAAYIEYFLYSVNDVNKVEQKLTTTGYLGIDWKDEFLFWDPKVYGNLDYVYIPQDNVWKPDISLQNSFKNLEQLGSNFFQVYVESDGWVYWYPFKTFESKCKLDPTFFPFDRQTCNVDSVVWSLDIDDVTLLVGNDGIIMEAASDSNGQWNVISSSYLAVTEMWKTKIRFSITMKRKPLFVVMNIIIPIILLSILNIFTFQIPADSGERMSYTITVWLAFAVFLTIVSASLPKSSDTVPIVSIYIMIQLGVGAVTVLISAIESRAVCRSDQPASYIRRISHICRKSRVAPTEETMQMNVSWKNGIVASFGVNLSC